MDYYKKKKAARALCFIGGALVAAGLSVEYGVVAALISLGCLAAITGVILLCEPT